MIITREQQEVIMDEYIKEKPSVDALAGFIEGMNAAFKLMDKLMKQNK